METLLLCLGYCCVHRFTDVTFSSSGLPIDGVLFQHKKCCSCNSSFLQSTSKADELPEIGSKGTTEHRTNIACVCLCVCVCVCVCLCTCVCVCVCVWCCGFVCVCVNVAHLGPRANNSLSTLLLISCRGARTNENNCAQVMLENKDCGMRKQKPRNKLWGSPVTQKIAKAFTLTRG